MTRQLLISYGALLLCASMLPAARAAPAPQAIIGIDHMPFVVHDIDQTAEAFRQLGFALKPGRFHQNGIVNRHIKFPDGSGIEFISAPRATDAMTKDYVEGLARGEGPMYFAFHAREPERLKAALDAAKVAYTHDVDGMMIPGDPQLRFLFFVQDNRASTDRPEHFAHGNSAVAMSAVWIALDDPAGLERLLLAVGAVKSLEEVLTPEPVAATVMKVNNGRIILLPGSKQRIHGRPIVGVTFEVRDLDTVRGVLNASHVSSTTPGGGAHLQILVPPDVTHGVTLAFEERRASP